MVRSRMSNAVYPIRWMALKTILKEGIIDKGIILGYFTFVLKYRYYSIELFDREIAKTMDTKDAYWWKEWPIYIIDQ